MDDCLEELWMIWQNMIALLTIRQGEIALFVELIKLLLMSQLIFLIELEILELAISKFCPLSSNLL